MTILDENMTCMKGFNPCDTLQMSCTKIKSVRPNRAVDSLRQHILPCSMEVCPSERN